MIGLLLENQDEGSRTDNLHHAHLQDMTPTSIYSSEIIIAVENYVSRLLREMLPPTRYFHNIHHTVEVVQKSIQLANFYNMPPADDYALIAAAWFHDTGYIHGSANHEEQSVKIAQEYLGLFHVAKDQLIKLEQLILSTRITSRPASLMEKILCDADLQHLGSEDYIVWSMLLRKELEHQNNIHFTDEEWNRQNIEFFKSHKFNTEHAETLWEEQKQKNLLLMLESEKAKER